MLNLKEQAEAIIAQLKASPNLATVAYIDHERAADGRPAELPAAYVTVGKSDFGEAAGTVSRVGLEWLVIVKTKSTGGETSTLPVLDTVLDSLSGFSTGVGGPPLKPAQIEYLGNDRGSIEHLVSFITTQQAEVLK